MTVLRASDADRDRVVAQLQHHVGAGRLTLDEFSHRAGAAYRARTLSELAELTRDLPTPVPPPAAPAHRLPRLFAAALALAVLAFLVGAAILTPWMGSTAAACH